MISIPRSIRSGAVATAAAVGLAISACASAPSPRGGDDNPVLLSTTLEDSLTVELGELCGRRLVELNRHIDRADASRAGVALIEARALRNEAARQMLSWNYHIALRLIDEAIALLSPTP